MRSSSTPRCDLCKREKGPLRVPLVRGGNDSPPPIQISVCRQCSELLQNHPHAERDAIEAVMEAETNLREQERNRADVKLDWKDREVKVWMAEEKLIMAMEHRTSVLHWRRAADRLLLSGMDMEVVGRRVYRIEGGRQMCTDVWAQMHAKQSKTHRMDRHGEEVESNTKAGGPGRTVNS